MKLASGVLLLAVAAAPALAQTIAGGPLRNAANGHRYYLIETSSWSAAEAWAIARGGHLASVKDSAENAWILANIANFGGDTYKLHTGLNDAQAEGVYTWTSGEPVGYVTWENGQPSSEDYGLMNPIDGKWSMRPANYSSFAVVEIEGPLRVPQEFATIEAAFAASQQLPGPDTIEIAPGDYQLTSRVEPSQPVTLRGAGAGATIVRGFASNFPIVTTSELTFEGIHFVHGDVSGGFTLAIVYDSQFVARDCVFTGVRADGETGPILLPLQGAVGRFERCLFRGLNAAVVSNGACSVVLLNCILDDLTRIVYTVSNHVSTLDASNCVFRNVGDGTELVGELWTTRIVNSVYSNVVGDPDRNDVTIDYSLLPVELLGGVGNLMGVPQFVDANAGDYCLRRGTIGVDAGSISRLLALMPSDLLDFGGENRVADDPIAPNSGSGSPPIDMGAHEVPNCIADANADGLLNIFDFLAFQTAFGNGC